ncbi:hypothetical protein [Aeromicrobium sp.]|uniref:hypothetical protein n=1 Tax=Aeromicrobium sp. TaxID=1871063 RepID=UPI0025B9804C|nr:hypothetical protein [Aeromicrobium sp.]MCK5891040.1 hypothetical protein [Aeromicrobium sp.]
MLEVGEVLGVRDGAGVEPLLVALPAGPHLLHLGLGLAQLAAQVTDERVELDPAVVELGLGGRDLGQDRQLRQRTSAVRQLGELGVDGGEVEQDELDVRCGFQRGLR